MKSTVACGWRDLGGLMMQVDLEQNLKPKKTLNWNDKIGRIVQAGGKSHKGCRESQRESYSLTLGSGGGPEVPLASALPDWRLFPLIQ